MKPRKTIYGSFSGNSAKNEWGLVHSIRDIFYNEERTQERKNLKMMKKSFTEVFFRSSMNNGRQKAFCFKEKTEIIRSEKIDFSKLSLEERTKLLPPLTGDQMAELKEYQKRMGYDENKMKSMKYKMTVYDKFLKEYEYRKKRCRVKENIQKKQRDRER